MDAATLRRVGWLYNPHVPLRLRLPQFLVVGVEVMELLRQDVRVGDEVVLSAPEPLLHLHVIVAKSVLARDFVAHWEVVDFLELVEALVQVALARAGRPQHVPLVRVREVEIVGLKDGTDELGLTFQNLIEHLAVVDVVAALGTLRLRWPTQDLRLRYRFYVHLLVKRLHRRRVDVLRQVGHTLLKVLVAFVEEVLLGSALTVVSRRNQQWEVVLNVAESVEDFDEFLSPGLLLLLLSCLVEDSFRVAKLRCAWSAREVSVNADPMRLELLLNKFESVEGAHVALIAPRRRLSVRVARCAASPL